MSLNSCECRHVRGGCSPEGRIHERKWWCYALVLRGHVFGGLLRPSPLSASFSSYSARHATDGKAGTARGFLFNSASTLFFGGRRSESRELLDNSSSAAVSLLPERMGSLPLFCLTEGAGRLLPRAFYSNPLPNKPAGDHFLAANGQHDSIIQPYVWPVLIASPPYLDANERTGLQGTDLLGCWP